MGNEWCLNQTLEETRLSSLDFKHLTANIWNTTRGMSEK